MHLKELMMAIIVASSALVGLGGASIGQLMQSNLEEYLKRRLRIGFVVCFGLAMVAIGNAVFWLMSTPSIPWRSAYLNVATILFFIQLALSSAAIIVFWTEQRRGVT